jgi:YYY domain-containing protein
MLIDFLTREGGVIAAWWLLVTLAGLAALPLALRLLGGLPDRGVLLARPLGLLLVGWVFWLLAMFGFVRNDTGGMALAYVIVAGVGLVAYFGGRGRVDLRAMLRGHGAALLVGEVIFAGALLTWAIYRAFQGDAFTTEKPMELAFLSGVMRSDTFPPNDPWFAGYAISYYYLGYVIAGLLSTLSGVSSGVGFSMTTALLFALVASSVYGVVYALVRSRGQGIGREGMIPLVAPPLDDASEQTEPPPPQDTPTSRPTAFPAIAAGIFGMVCVLLLSNFVLPLVEFPYQTGTATTEYLQFWDMNQRERPLQTVSEGRESLSRWDYWWWFRSARALSDRGLNGQHSEVIDEFPAFSFVLADNHPHVLALPFAALALGLMFNLVMLRRAPARGEVVLYGVVIGGLIFLNTWDGAIYLLGLGAAEGLRRIRAGGRGRLTSDDWVSVISFGAAVGGIGVVSVLPFLISFRSQLGGVLPNLINPTYFPQFFLMFAPLLLLIVPYLLVEVWRGGARTNWRYGTVVGGSITAILLLFMLLFALFGAIIPGAADVIGRVIAESGGSEAALSAILLKRTTHLPTTLLLTLLLVLVAARLFPRKSDDRPENSPDYPIATGFVLLLVALGTALTLAPEFVYLRDNFGSRMNTVFKFYYQAWLIWGVAAAYAAYSVLSDIRLRAPSPLVRAAYAATLGVVLLFGMPFIFMAAYHRAAVETGREAGFAGAPTLDGAQSYMSIGGLTGDDMAALACLSARVRGADALVVQAVGGSYQGMYGTVGTLTGIPVMFNWYGHQGQWRGDALASLVGGRLSEIDIIYTDPTWNSTRAILQQYGVDYIVVGTAERRHYNERLVGAETKLRDRLEVVCEFGATRIYRVTPESLVLALNTG